MQHCVSPVCGTVFHITFSAVVTQNAQESQHLQKLSPPQQFKKGGEIKFESDDVENVSWEIAENEWGGVKDINDLKWCSEPPKPRKLQNDTCRLVHCNCKHTSKCCWHCEVMTCNDSQKSCIGIPPTLTRIMTQPRGKGVLHPRPLQ